MDMKAMKVSIMWRRWLMVDDEGSEPEAGENSHHDFGRRRRGRDPRVEEDSQIDDAVTII